MWFYCIILYCIYTLLLLLLLYIFLYNHIFIPRMQYSSITQFVSTAARARGFCTLLPSALARGFE